MRRIRILLVLLTMVVAFSMLSVGAAFAHSNGAEHAFEANELDNSAPVGQNALQLDPTTPGPHPGQFKGFGTGNAVAAIANNPLCPAHHAHHGH